MAVPIYLFIYLFIWTSQTSQGFCCWWGKKAERRFEIDHGNSSEEYNLTTGSSERFLFSITSAERMHPIDWPIFLSGFIGSGGEQYCGSWGRFPAQGLTWKQCNHVKNNLLDAVYHESELRYVSSNSNPTSDLAYPLKPEKVEGCCYEAAAGTEAYFSQRIEEKKYILS